MSDLPQGEGWWEASDGKWYPPEKHPDYRPPPPPPEDPAIPPEPDPGRPRTTPTEPPAGSPIDQTSGDGGGSQSRRWVWVVGAGLIVLVLVLAGVAIASNDDSSTSTPPPLELSYTREQAAELGILNDETEEAIQEMERSIDELLDGADMSAACEDDNLRTLLSLGVLAADISETTEENLVVDIDRYVDQLCY